MNVSRILIILRESEGIYLKLVWYPREIYIKGFLFNCYEISQKCFRRFNYPTFKIIFLISDFSHSNFLELRKLKGTSHV